VKTRIRATFPESTDPRMHAAVSAMTVHDYPTMRAHLLSVLADYPRSVSALRMLTISFYQRAEWASCVQFADALLRIYPHFPLMQSMRAQALLPLGRTEDALAGARYGVTYLPRSSIAHMALLFALAHQTSDDAQYELLAAAAHARRLTAFPPAMTGARRPRSPG